MERTPQDLAAKKKKGRVIADGLKGIIYMNNFNKFIECCISLFDKGALFDENVTAFISRNFDTSSPEKLKTDFRDFLLKKASDETKAEAQRIGLSITVFNSIIDRTKYPIINSYAPCTINPIISKSPFSKRSEKKSYDQKTEGAYISRAIKDLFNQLDTELIYRDIDTANFIVIKDSEPKLLSYDDTCYRLIDTIKESVYTSGFELPQDIINQAEKELPKFLKNRQTTSYFSHILLSKTHLSECTPYTSITDILQWDNKILSTTDLNNYIEYVSISFYVLANMHLYRNNNTYISKPSVFPYLINEEQKTGKTSFLEDLFSVYYPSNMTVTFPKIPNDKELVENLTFAQDPYNKNITGISCVLFDESTINPNNHPKIKELITKENFIIRRAYDPKPISIPNNRFYGFTSNEHLQILTSERRFFVIPKCRYIGDRQRSIHTFFTLANEYIAKFKTLTLTEQTQYFNELEKHIQELAKKTSLATNLLQELVSEYRDIIDNYYLTYGYITPNDIKEKAVFKGLANVKQKELIKIMELAGYTYRRHQIDNFSKHRIMCYVPLPETKERLK